MHTLISKQKLTGDQIACACRVSLTEPPTVHPQHFLVKYNKDDGFTAFLTSENVDRVLLRNVTRRQESVNTASPSLPTCCANGPGPCLFKKMYTCQAASANPTTLNFVRYVEPTAFIATPTLSLLFMQTRTFDVSLYIFYSSISIVIHILLCFSATD